MSCFPCFGNKKSNDNENDHEEVPVAHVKDATPPLLDHPSPPPVNNRQFTPVQAKINKNEASTPEIENSGARTFTFRELAMATKNFRQECLLGEGGFGKVYKATLQSGEVVAVKRLDRIGTQGNKEFIVEVLALTLLHHPSLVSLIGYCADGEQRLLVYEYLPFGSLESHLHVYNCFAEPLNWQTRMKIALGTAQGLEYLHEKANPAIIYRDLKMSNILLDEEYNPKLSDYGLAKLAQGNTKMHVSPRVMGTYGYCAPEYERNGELTTKSDVYSFGVVLLELITGRRALDTTRPTEEQNLVTWAQPIFKNPKRFQEIADPLLKMQFPERSLNQAVGITAMCLQDEPSVRPLISDVVNILGFLTVAPPQEAIPATLSAPGAVSEVKQSGEHDDRHNSDNSDHDDGESEDEDISNSDNDSNGSWMTSDDEDEGTAAYQHKDSQHWLPQESMKLGKQSSSSKHKNKVKKKHDSRKFGRQGSSSHKKNKVKDHKGSISFTSSSSRSSHHRSRSSSPAAGPHGSDSVNLRLNSIEESQDSSIGLSLEQCKYEETFSWSIGSSMHKSRSESAHLDSGSNGNDKLQNISLDSNRRLENSMRSKNGSIGSYSRQSSNSGSEDGSYSSRDCSDDEIEHDSKS
ncbi:hypothetical protein ACH5RR_016235 [Cinchona calisaya]|uniref:non-specific serine/threonine protein kinase n=1 Tax=Cinchona calisaya TaxID=153742 RepID=A0ABD2ZVF1_9GENT